MSRLNDPDTSRSPRAVVLLSGGLDSATVLAIARHENRQCYPLAIDYGQRHRHELVAARAIAASVDVEPCRTVSIDLRTIGGSALTDDRIEVPTARDESEMAADIPPTYVPARNLTFLSVAAGYAEVVGAREIWIGVNAVDYSGYPDCRPEFIEAFERVVALATKAGVEGSPLRIRTPLIEMTKAEIITRGTELGVDYALTHSCYAPSEDGRACGVCDSCILRRRGFEQAGVIDPTRYASGAFAR